MDFTSKGISVLKNLGFAKQSENALGIDIGSSSVKVAQIKKEKERAVLETYGEIAVGPYKELNVGQAAKLTQEKAVEILKDVLKESNVKSKKAVVSIPLHSSFITVIDIPLLEGKDPREIIQMEARRYVPLPITEVEIDWWVLPESSETEITQEAGQKTSKVILVAIHKNVIKEYTSVVAAAGLEVAALEIESFSTIRSVVGNESVPVVAMDFGASSVKIAIVDGGVMRAAHLIAKGSQDITLALSRSMGVDFSRAEQTKREIGLSDLPEHKEIVSVVDPILEHIFSETNNFIKNYQRKERRAVGRVVLTGGGSLMNGLVDFAVKRLGLETSLADPFAKTDYPVFLAGALKESGPTFSVSVGLALRGLQ